MNKPTRGGLANRLLEKTSDIVASIDPHAARSHASGPPRTSPGRLLDHSEKLAEAEAMLAEAMRMKAQAEAQLRQGGFDQEIALVHIQEVPGRRRMLTDEQFNELKANLANHALITPVTVRALENDRYELIAGHNRVQAFRDLGRKTIKAVVMPEGAMDVELAAFYSNLLSPALTDWEKYLGFKRRKDATGQAVADIAKEAGVAVSTLYRWMAMDNLSDEAKAIIASQPGCINAATVQELLQLQNTQTAELILTVLRELAAGQINQTQAIAKVKAAKRPALPKAAPFEEVIKEGRKKVCTITSRGGIVALKFADEEHAKTWGPKIAELIRNTLVSE